MLWYRTAAVSDSVSSKSASRLAREPDDHVGRERDVRACRSRIALDEIEVALARVAPAHRRRARASSRTAPAGAGACRPSAGRASASRKPRRDVPRMRAREPDALDARRRRERLEQRREVAGRIVGRLVVVDDLPEQLHFACARRRRLADLGQDVGLRPHPLVPARVRHDAEAAELVAAFDDRDVGLDGIAAPRHAQRKRHVVVADRGRRPARRALRRAACSTSIGSRRIACVPDDDVGDAGASA